MTADNQGRATSPALVDTAAQEAWLKVRLDRCSTKFRLHAESILSWSTSDADRVRRAATVENLHAMIDELWAYREAADSAASRATQRVSRLERDYHRAEAGRQALLRGLDGVEREIDLIDLDASMARLISSSERTRRMRAATSRAHELHRKAMEGS